MLILFVGCWHGAHHNETGGSQEDASRIDIYTTRVPCLDLTVPKHLLRLPLRSPRLAEESKRGKRPKGVFGKGVGHASEMRQKCVRNASKMRQECVKMGLVLLGKKERPKCVRNPSKLRQKCAEHLWGRTPFGRYRI